MATGSVGSCSLHMYFYKTRATCEIPFFRRLQLGLATNCRLVVRVFLDYLATNHDKYQRQLRSPVRQDQFNLLYLLVSTRAGIGQFSGPYSPVRPAKI